MVGSADSSATGGEKSIRRRFTTSIKRVMSMGSNKSKASAESGEAAPAAGPSSAPAAPAKYVPLKVSSTEPAAAPPKAEEKPRTKTYRAPKVPTTPPPVMSAAERAQALFKKHNIEIDPKDWPLSSAPAGERVQKDIRMRVHRTCHKCEATFGPDKVCKKCEHKRCKKCPRHPIKKSKDKGKEKVGAKTGATPGYKKRRGDVAYGLTIPSKKAGGQDLVRKPVRQRVHRRCHRCQADFRGQKVCPGCSHNRCKRCPREPFKTNKPPGYYEARDNDPDASDIDEPMFPPPPRRTYKRPRHRVRWTCTQCSTTFVEKNKTCGGCGSHRDTTGNREPPKKDKKGRPSTSELTRLSERLRQTNISA